MLAPNTSDKRAAPPETNKLFFKIPRKGRFCEGRSHTCWKTPKVNCSGQILKVTGHPLTPPSNARYTTPQIGANTNKATRVSPTWVVSCCHHFSLCISHSLGSLAPAVKPQDQHN